MSEVSDDIIGDIQAFVSSFSTFHEAYVREEQHIFRHVFDQVNDFDRSKTEYYQKENKQEPIWTFERKNLTVHKRIFHPGQGEHVTGADFVLYKNVSSPGKVGITAVQVKRNRGQRYFGFSKREIDQLLRLLKFCKSSYFLLIDETTKPPTDCFVSVKDLMILILSNFGPKVIKIPNADIKKYCIGSKSFYNLFYNCTRGSKKNSKDYLKLAIEYIHETKRVLVELFTDVKKE